MKTLDYIYLTVALIILTIMLLCIHPTNVKTISLDTTKYTDSIKKLNALILVDEKMVASYEKTIDSLKTLPEKIKIKYYEQKSKIPNASVAELDSIIRSNAGLPQR
jgi:hypothetical protein